MTLLSNAELAALEALRDAGRAQSRVIAARRMTSAADIWRAPSGGGANALYASAVACHIYSPAGSQDLQLLADLGGPRATMVGEMAIDADVTEGDELRVGSAVYLVERAQVKQNSTLLALSQLKRQG